MGQPFHTPAAIPARTGRRVAILQSCYVPWKGVFDLAASSDEFVLLDEVQMTTRDWRTRNRIRTAAGLAWLSVPVQAHGHRERRIDETLVADARWAARHWRTIRQAYAKAPFLDLHEQSLAAAYEAVGSMERLSDVNRHLLEWCLAALGIDTPVRWSTDYAAATGRTERLLSICLQAGADEYLSGPAARDYLDTAAMAAAGVRVRWADYSGYPEYPQLHDAPFEHGVSVLDLLLNTGPAARDHLLLATRGDVAAPIAVD